jgi:glucokinase
VGGLVTEQEDVVRQYAVGVDIGGTKIAAGLVDREANIICRYKTKEHRGTLPSHVIDFVEEAYQTLLQQSGVAAEDLAGVGLGFPGHVNGRAGVVINSSNLPQWDNVPLRHFAAQRLGVPVVLENDTKVCGLAEYLYGAGRGARHMCYITFSTGCGLAIIIDGRLYLGHIGTSGEVGHTVVDVNGPLCTCGKRGCALTYTCGLGLARMAHAKIQDGANTVLREMAAKDPAHISGEMIAEAARQGDAVAKELLDTAGYYAGVILSTVVEVLNPELIVIGGGMTRIGPLFMEPCMRGLRENVHRVQFESVRIVPWQLGDDSGVLGAAAKAFVTLEEQPGEACPES